MVMRRTLIRVTNQSFLGWNCSECGWLFKPSDAHTGDTPNEMTRVLFSQHDTEFADHVCVEHPQTRHTQPFGQVVV